MPLIPSHVIQEIKLTPGFEMGPQPIFLSVNLPVHGGSSAAAPTALQAWKSPHVRQDELLAQMAREDEEILVIITTVIRMLDE